MTVDIQSLMDALPIFRLTPRCIAGISGFVDQQDDWSRLNKPIFLWEPPAGKRVPFITPDDALPKILCYQGMTVEQALALTRSMVTEMKKSISEEQWVIYYDTWEPDAPINVSVFDFVNWLKSVEIAHYSPFFNNNTTLFSIASALEEVGYEASTAPILTSTDYEGIAFSLKNLPTTPAPRAMMEFVRPTWYEPSAETDTLYYWWKMEMQNIAAQLEKALGEPVFYFADPNDDCDDDTAHRFIILHWCCTFKPHSTFVQYLCRKSGAKDVEELKKALLDSANYLHPFKMHNALDDDFRNETLFFACVLATYTEKGLTFAPKH
ncbi:hypothetical protein [Pelistega europaea]|uniref:Uncharacterized protein n=1 Tax=Pelistega europaea TaxID=106147 RepID=A0A7Y4LB51_9BURK|nr:hypothetical protein [Pelistega europaea]NOL50335.1 hypothetical protein [Pelistega europaea]